MDDYADVYYVDTRNADPRDRRTGSSTTVRPTGRPVTTIYAPGSGGRPMPYAQQAPIYYQAPQPSATAALFGKLTTGQVVDMVAQLFAMLQTLPSAPVATRDAGTDVANLMTLCRARHYVIYAGRRIMPGAFGPLDGAEADLRGIIQALSSVRHVAG